MNPEKRERRAVETFKNASLSIGTVTKGMSLFGVTRGQFSMIDLILATLDQVGPARVTLWTWCIAEYEVKCFNRLMIDKRITSALLVIDSQARQKNADILHDWQNQHGAGSIKWVVNHAKLATVETPDFRLLLRGSMNLNYNPRFEQFDLDEGHPGFDVVQGIEAELPTLEFNHHNGDARRATQIEAAHSSEMLLPFTVRKTWAK